MASSNNESTVDDSTSENTNLRLSNSIVRNDDVSKITRKNKSCISASNNEKYKLFLIIYKFLQQQISENCDLNPVQKESLEVIIQCLGYAFKFYEFDYIENNLQTIYEFYETHKNDFSKESRNLIKFEVSSEDIAKAEELKETGNKLMKEEKFNEALTYYDKAINFNPNEPALYCNRAATLNNLKRYSEAINDCQTALYLNSSYAKAYIRKGFAYEKLQNMKKALKCYKKAHHLEPSNEHYKNKYNDASARFTQKTEENSNPLNAFLGSSSNVIRIPELGNLVESIFDDMSRR